MIKTHFVLFQILAFSVFEQQAQASCFPADEREMLNFLFKNYTQPTVAPDREPAAQSTATYNDTTISYLVSDSIKFTKYNKENKQQDLIEAAASGDTEHVRLLVEKYSASQDTTDDSGYTALMYAIENGHDEIAKFLIGAVINLEDLYQETTLDIQNAYGQTALIMAASNNKISIVDALIAKGVDLNLESQGQAALGFAIGNGCEESVKALITAKALVKSNTLIQAWSDHSKPISINIINQLIEAGIDIQAEDSNGKTVLMIAKEKGFTEIVGLLEKDIGPKEDEETAFAKTLETVFYRDTAIDNKRAFVKELKDKPAYLQITEHFIDLFDRGSFLSSHEDKITLRRFEGIFAPRRFEPMSPSEKFLYDILKIYISFRDFITKDELTEFRKELKDCVSEVLLLP